MKKSHKKIGILVISLIAFSGSIFFFPMNLGGRHTCFYHRLFDHHDEVNENVNNTSSYVKVKISSESQDDYAGNDITNDMVPARAKSGNQEKDSEKELICCNGSILLDKYLHHYAFPWWFSVALTALSIFLWKRLKKDLNRISRN